MWVLQIAKEGDTGKKKACYLKTPHLCEKNENEHLAIYLVSLVDARILFHPSFLSSWWLLNPLVFEMET